MKLKKIFITRYGPLSGVDLDIGEGLQIIYGKNEAGKTLTIDAIIKIMLQGKTRDFEHINRVNEDPEGYILMEDQEGREIKVTMKEGLAGHMDVGSLDLRNILIIRDSDLSIKDESGYYRGITDKLTGIQLERLKRLLLLLKDYGRLTRAESNAGLSDNKEFKKIATLRSRALAFIREADDYFKEARKSQADNLELDLLSTGQKIDDISRKIRLLEKASSIQGYDNISSVLKDIEDYWQEYIKLRDFDQKCFDRLNSGHIELASIKKEIGEQQKKLADFAASREKKEEERSRISGKLKPFELKLKGIEQAKHDLEVFNERKSEETGGEGKLIKILMIVFSALTILGFPAVYFPTGIIGFSFILPGASFMAVIILSIVLLKKSRREAVFSLKASSLVENFRKLGLRIKSIDDLYPEIEGFEEEHSILLEQRGRIENEIKGIIIKEDNSNERIKELSSRQSGLEREITEIFSSLGIVDMNGFKKNFTRRVRLETDIKAAVKSLFSNPDFLKGSGEGMVRVNEETSSIFGDLEKYLPEWKKILEDTRPHAEERDRDLPEFNRKEYEHLKKNLEELEGVRDHLTSSLENHRRTLANFETGFLDMALGNFIEDYKPVEINSLPLLKNASEVAGRFVEKIDLEYRTACEAISIFEEIKTDEEAKISDLFRELEVAGIFEDITVGKYQEVRFDPAGQKVEVLDSAGRSMDAAKLSKGAYDQLFLALRVALSRRVFGGHTGFFIMDDAFLSSDRERLQKQFDILKKMAGSGWSILYFSVKDEVKELAAGFSDNKVIELQALAM